MTDMTIAKTILQQIKTIDPWAMSAWGADNLVAKEDALQFKTTGMTPWKGIVTVRYIAGADHYDVEFGQIRKYEYKVRNLVEGVYAPELVDVIDNYVG